MKRLTSKPFHARPCLIPRANRITICTAPRGGGRCTPVIVLSPVKSSLMILLPPEGAFLEHCAGTISTVSALPDFVRPLNLQLSVSLLCRLTLAIVLSPGNYPQDNFLPPEGAGFPERCTNAKMCLLQLRAFMMKKPAPRVRVSLCLTVDRAKRIHGGQAGAYMFAGWGTNRPLSRHYNCKCADVLRPSA